MRLKLCDGWQSMGRHSTREGRRMSSEILRHFEYSHLRTTRLRGISAGFRKMAVELDVGLGSGAEKSEAMRCLLNSKDAAVRQGVVDAQKAGEIGTVAQISMQSFENVEGQGHRVMRSEPMEDTGLYVTTYEFVKDGENVYRFEVRSGADLGFYVSDALDYATEARAYKGAYIMLSRLRQSLAAGVLIQEGDK